MKFTVHSVIKNEDKWVWFALQSVLPFCEEILVYDTGSSDNTVSIIKSIKSPKIKFEERGLVTPEQLVDLRREQIKSTKTDWFLIIDGDEIWPEENLKKLIDSAKSLSEDKVALFNRVRNCIGDIYHYLPESSGRYQIGGIKGHLNIRLIRKVPHLSVKGVYPLESYTLDDKPVQEQAEKLEFIDTWLLHTSFLQRSSLDESKTSGSLGKKKLWEKGILMDEKELPGVLFKKYPSEIGNPFKKRTLSYELMAVFNTPIINLKRKFK